MGSFRSFEVAFSIMIPVCNIAPKVMHQCGNFARDLHSVSILITSFRMGETTMGWICSPTGPTVRTGQYLMYNYSDWWNTMEFAISEDQQKLRVII